MLAFRSDVKSHLNLLLSAMGNITDWVRFGRETLLKGHCLKVKKGVTADERSCQRVTPIMRPALAKPHSSLHHPRLEEYCLKSVSRIIIDPSNLHLLHSND